MRTLIGNALRRIGIYPEKTWYAVIAFANGLLLRLSKFVGSETSDKSFRFVMIDRVNTRQGKFLVDIEALAWRLDVTGLMNKGVRMSSDVRTLNRGPLVIGRAWTEDYNHKIVDPFVRAKSRDYRFVTHETVRLMFVEGARWGDTPEYRLFKSQLEAGSEPYGLKSVSDLEERGENILRLYESLATDGYMRSEDVGAPYWDEAHVYVSSSGEVCVGRHGNHRLAIARLLELSSFPAVFGGAHIDWVVSLGGPSVETREIVFSEFERIGGVCSIQ